MPLFLIALLIVATFGFLLAISYFSVALLIKLFRGLMASSGRSSLPKSVRRSLDEAQQYATLIKRTAQQHPAGPIQDRLYLTIKPVDEWLINLAKLERALIKVYVQQNLPRELRRAKSEIEELHRQLLTADAEETKILQALIGSKKKHVTALKALQAFQSQAELKIRKIATDLGATHAEMLLLTAKGNFSDNRFRRLDENLQDNLSNLKDILAAMDDVKYSGITS
jgi:hypothetical protein